MIDYIYIWKLNMYVMSSRAKPLVFFRCCALTCTVIIFYTLSVECYSYWTKLACRLLNYLNFVQHSTQFSGQFSYWCRVNCYTAHARGVHIDIDYYWMDGVWLRPYARAYGSSRAGVSLGSSEWTSCPLGCMEGNTWRRLYLNSSSRSISSSLIPPPSWPAYLE